uniref:Putative group iii salivary lipocalin n=1 Tax=Rhipicephalus pulchellus TaxID=72859 RepID=L7LQR8_RHIPC
MAAFTALILWAVATSTMASNGMFSDPSDIHIPCYQEPWWLASSVFNVYLLSVSEGNWKNKERICVRSQYLRGNSRNRTAWRTLDFYSVNEASARSSLGETPINVTTSVNIALDAHTKGEGLLDANVTTNFADLMFLGVNTSDPCYTGQYQFSVLYGDNRCLLLETRNTGYLGRSALSTERHCSLWIHKRDIKNPLQCCVFMFHILCGRSVQVFEDSCFQEQDDDFS